MSRDLKHLTTSDLAIMTIDKLMAYELAETQRELSELQQELVADEKVAWKEFIDRTYGSIPDEDFIRHPQGEYEVREELE